MELSTLKLFRDYPELMAEYDIRDEYELHNLLRKIWPKEQEGDGRVRFKKMPTVEIGTPDRERQVMDLLMQYAPISNIELAQRYEEAYGIKSGSALANHFPCIDAYLHNGVYCIDLPVLPAEQRQRMAELLTRDFYRMAEVRRIYRVPTGPASTRLPSRAWVSAPIPTTLCPIAFPISAVTSIIF